MGSDFISLDEAAERFDIHRNTLMRLLREGSLLGHKASSSGRRRWFASVASLRHYSNPWVGFVQELWDPKRYPRLKSEDDEEDELLTSW